QAAQAVQPRHRGTRCRRGAIAAPSPAAHVGVLLQELEYRCPDDVSLAPRSAPPALAAWEPGDRDEQRRRDHWVTTERRICRSQGNAALHGGLRDTGSAARWASDHS